MAAVVAGWRPPLGSGKHTHLNAGMGIASNLAESGWIKDYESQIPSTLSVWENATHLLCDAELQSWTPAPGGGSSRFRSWIF